jgi:hypothetical protein
LGDAGEISQGFQKESHSGIHGNLG